jgi:putative endopeptidase
MRVSSPALTLAALLGLVAGCSRQPAPTPASAAARAPAEGGPDRAAPPADGRDLNFGLPLGFSVEKMDRSADPRRDFARYAAGTWLDVAVIPADTVRVSALDLRARQVDRQLAALAESAARGSQSAAPGTPAQQVGDFYASGMDEATRTRQGLAPIAKELEAIAAASPAALARTLARQELILGEPVLAGLLVSTHPADRSRYAVFLADGQLPLGADNYLTAAGAPVREAHARRIAATLELAGVTPADAARRAAAVLACEVRIAQKKLTPVQRRDPRLRFQPMPFARAQALIPRLDLAAMLEALGLPPQSEIVVVEPEAVRERNALLAEWSADDTRDYVRWELISRMTPYLSPAFEAPGEAFAKALYGDVALPSRQQRVVTELTRRLGHPLGQLYVEAHFPPTAKAAAEELVGRVTRTLRTRMRANRWLSAETRQQALAKLDAIAVKVGYPSQWIDWSGVAVRRDDYAGNVLRLNEAGGRRDVARFGRPVVHDDFVQPGATLPTDINAAYDSGRNGIQIPAAFLQAPFYDPAADAAVNYCTLGAVIGHEITHAFDSSGRQYDAAGAVRDWWTEADARAFLQGVQPLVDQANAFEVLPGLRANGALAVGENLADVGGVSLAFEALTQYLAEHPQEGAPIDGLTPQQRCFLAWGQVWADKANEGWLRQVTATDGHPPGRYRMLAPLQHEPGFFTAFAIRAGDPSWRAEAARVRLW